MDKKKKDKRDYKNFGPMIPHGRKIAYDVLLRVYRGGAWSGITLDAALRERPDLPAKEIALATELVYGTLRRSPVLDKYIESMSSRLMKDVDERVLVVLRLGIYQILFTRIPDHAAVDESVNLACAAGAHGASGFVNAILRGILRNPPEKYFGLEDNPQNNLFIEESLPYLLYREWKAKLPDEEIADLAAAMNEKAATCLRASSPQEREKASDCLHEAGFQVKKTPLSPVGLFLAGGGHPERAMKACSGLQLQDEGAQLTVCYALLPGMEKCAGKEESVSDKASFTCGSTELCQSFEDNGKEPGLSAIKNVLDSCAAPGGKTCHLAQSLPKAHITAMDLHRRRAEGVRAEAERLGLSDRVRVYAADATLPLPFAVQQDYDLIFADAPCTGFGTLRRNPEIKLFKGDEDIERLASLQKRILASLAGYVKPGGRLVYAVCTMTDAECGAVVEDFLLNHPEFRPDPPLLEALPEQEINKWEKLLEPEGALRLWTHRHDTDCFYAMRFVRVS